MTDIEIPRVIHYCWFGENPLPDLAKKCINSWKKYCPNYEIVEWNESNFAFNDCAYAKEAYEAKKWAFVSDYARFKILYEKGGLYFDTDVEIIKPIDDILNNGPFLGCEKDGTNIPIKQEYCLENINDDAVVLNGLLVAPGLGMAAQKGNSFCEEMTMFYKKIHFKDTEDNLNLTTVVLYTTKALYNHGLKNTDEIQMVDDITIYPKEYFCPADIYSGEVTITENTRSIHHYSASWVPDEERTINELRKKYFKRIKIFKIAHWLSLIVGFAKFRGVLKMPKAMIEYKISNLNAKKSDK